MRGGKLLDLSRQELLAMLDELDRSNIEPNVGFLREELFRRDCEAQNAELVRMTAEIRLLTRVMAFLTLVVTAATIAMLRNGG